MSTLTESKIPQDKKYAVAVQLTLKDTIFLRVAFAHSWKEALCYALITEAVEINATTPELMDKDSVLSVKLNSVKLVAGLPEDLDAAMELVYTQGWNFNVKEID